MSVASTPGTEGEELAGPQQVPGKKVGLWGVELLSCSETL